jgi:hypothetical protein
LAEYPSFLDAFPRSYEVDREVELPGGSGGGPVHYVPNGTPGLERDGPLARITPEGGASWLGMFAGCTGFSACPGPFHLLAWGYEQTVLGDVRAPHSFRDLGVLFLQRLLPLPAHRRLLVLNYHRVVALGPEGEVWWRDVRELDYAVAVRIEADCLRVLADPPWGTGSDQRFDLATGAVRSR